MSWAILMLMLAVQGARELAAALARAGRPADGLASMVGAGALPIVPLIDQGPMLGFVGLVLVAALAIAHWRTGARAVPGSLLAAVWVGGPLALLVALRQSAQGFDLAMWTVLVGSLTDVLAMFGGLFFGRTPLAPKISPGKTVEGVIAGLGGAVLAAAACRFAFPDVAALAYFSTAVAVGIANIAGDLLASRLKRAAGLKDFGAALPGHGGMMDRLDGLLLAIPAAFLLAPVLRS